MSVQRTYGPARPLDPRAEKLEMEFVTGVGLLEIEPVPDWPGHTCLLALRRQAKGKEPVLVRHREGDTDYQTLLAMRPEDVQTLVLRLNGWLERQERKVRKL